VTLPGSSATSSDGSVLATHTISGKEYQVVLQADDSGHLQQTLPTYTWWVPGQAVGASKLMADIFNGVGSGKVIEMRGLWAIPKTDVAVVGAVGVEIGLYRSSAVGTGGTAHTYNGGSAASAHVITPVDTTNAALPAQITARAAPTAGATIGALYWANYVPTEETATSMAYLMAMISLLPDSTMGQRIALREGEGLLIKQGTVAGVGTIGFLAQFTLV
jgi:hypothetical protein